jgi:hypothetical protein
LESEVESKQEGLEADGDDLARAKAEDEAVSKKDVPQPVSDRLTPTG